MILSAIKICEAPLLIVDELGRGTSPIEGVGIAHAIAQEIIEAKATCFFATHFRASPRTLSPSRLLTPRPGARHDAGKTSTCCVPRRADGEL